MKINYKNTALGLIDDPKKFTFGFPDPDITPKMSKGELLSFGYSIINNASLLKDICGNNIQYISHSFFEAFAKGKSKLSEVFAKEEMEEGGIIIMGGHQKPYTHWHTYYYYVKTWIEDGQWNYDLLFMDFSKPAINDIPNLDIYVSVHGDTIKQYIWNGYLDDGRDVTWWESFIIAFVLFKKYCDIETKIVSPQNRRTKVAGNKYVNETDKRITILDSTWFTTIVRSGAFMVGDETGGFLRWQRYGPGKSLKKLIWVLPFEKEGYTRTAKVLNQNINTDSTNDQTSKNST
jgi:hypothetical protein